VQSSLALRSYIYLHLRLRLMLNFLSHAVELGKQRDDGTSV